MLGCELTHGNFSASTALLFGKDTQDAMRVRLRAANVRAAVKIGAVKHTRDCTKVAPEPI
jgi:hypothetical protein